MYFVAPIVMIAILFPLGRLQRDGWVPEIFDYLFDTCLVGFGVSFLLWLTK